MLTDVGFLERQNAVLEHATPQEILALVLYAYGPRLAISTAFGVDGCALIHMALQIEPTISVFTIDTGFLFEETEALKREFVERYELSLETVTPSMTVDEQNRELGEKLYERDSNRCCAIRKVEPTQRIITGLDCWVAALRRDQGPSRRAIPILQRFQRGDGPPLIKVHPFANWTRREVWSYVLENDVPYNQLLDRGYKSIGCWPCTRAVGAGESERAGRWNGEKDECGIHSEGVTVPAESLRRNSG